MLQHSNFIKYFTGIVSSAIIGFSFSKVNATSFNFDIDEGIDLYQDKAIGYNIGDFIFNHETKDTGIFQLKIDNDGNFQYYFKPCKQEDKYTYLLTGEEKKRVLNKMQTLSPNITIESDGQFYNKNNTTS